MDNGSNVVTTGSKGYRKLDYDCVISGWTIFSNISGSTQIDIKKSTYGDYPSFSSIVGSNYPSLTNTDKNQSEDLSGWTTSITSGDVLEWYINSVSNITKLSFFLKIKRI